MQARRTRGTALAAVIGLTTIGLTATLVPAGTAATAPAGAGSDGRGDSYFPYAGNGGYDVRSYGLDLTYAPPSDPNAAQLSGRLDGVATIDLVATQDLPAFNLDLRGLTVSKVTVDGHPATFWQEQDDQARRWELTVVPRTRLRVGASATVVVTYGGATTRPTDIEGFNYGWVTTGDGAMVAGEPEGAMTWYPVSDHPTDKAAYTFEITVPQGKVAVANGLQSRRPVTTGGWTTWFWDAPDQMAAISRPRRSVTSRSVRCGTPRAAFRSWTPSTPPSRAASAPPPTSTSRWRDR